MASFFKKIFGTGTGAIIGGLLGGPIGALAGGMIGSSYDQNEANKEMLKKSNQYDYYLWNQQNAYNDPSAQMQRLAQAGLNPNMVYGSGNTTGNSTSVAHSNGVADQQSLGSSLMSGYQQFLTAQQMSANIANTNANTNLANAQAKNVLSSMTKTDLQNGVEKEKISNSNVTGNITSPDDDSWFAKYMRGYGAGVRFFNNIGENIASKFW